MEENPGTSNAIAARTFYSKRQRPSKIAQRITENLFGSDSEDITSDDDDIEDPEYRPPLVSDDEAENIPNEEEPLILHIDENRENELTPKRKKGKLNNEWKGTNNTNVHPQFPPYLGGPTDDNDVNCSPISYFKRFFTDELLDKIVYQSNIYAIQKNPNKPLNVSREELEQWIGIAMRMSLTKISDTRLHWAAGSLSEAIATVMSRQRWEDIKANFHLVDNLSIDQTDRLAKVRLLVDYLRDKFKNIPITEHLSIDEQMVPFKGTSSLKQYIPKKPIKWGYKLFVLADHKGMVYDFFPYCGKILPVGRDGVPDLGPSSNSVLNLAETIPEHVNHKLYIDNWFTSIPLIEHLATRGIWVCGTIQARRIPGLSFKDDKKLALEGRGSFDEHHTDIGDTTISAIKWYDNRTVCLASSFVASSPVEQARMYDKKVKDYINVPIPHMVQMYNKHMGGVDLHDQLLSYYRMVFRSKKFYMRLIFHMMDMAVANSWLLYRRAADEIQTPRRKQNSLSQFKLRLSNSLLFAGKSTSSTRRGRPSSVTKAHKAKKMNGKGTRPIPEEDIRLDKVDHFPDFAGRRGMCKMPGCTGRIMVFCKKCNVHLCFERSRNCFTKFHME